MRLVSSLTLAIVCLAAAACGKSEEAPKAPPSKASTLSYAEIPASSPAKYPLKTCVVHDSKELSALGHPPYAIAYRGYEVQFCGKECLEEFADDPETYVLKVNPRAIFKDNK